MANLAASWSITALILTALAPSALAAHHGASPPRAIAQGAVVPTYAKNVASLLNTRCVSCHRPGEVAPFSLMGYENARMHASMISEVTESRRMPPWKAVHGYGEFRGENRLTSEEIALLANWAKAGSPRGDKRYEPKVPVFTSEWSLGKPDLILSQG